MKRIFTILSVLLLLRPDAGAQVTGVRTGSGTPVITAASPVMYMDNVRAAVASMFTVGSTDFSITATSAGAASGFRVGDMALIIQMRGANVGQHQNATVISVTGPIIGLRVVALPRLPFVAGGGSNKVQVVKINEYTTLTLTGGMISCNPWNESAGTGGVLCFTVSDVLTISGGIINAAGKGFGPDGVSWGLGGNGAAGATMVTPTGNPAPTDAFMACTGTILSPGFDGGAANNTGALGTANSPASPVPYSAGAPVFKFKAVMGSAGYYPTSYQGGKGAGGGGKGGNGGNTCAGSGATGLNGIAGQKGGNAGRGAAGGGILIVKARRIDASGMDPNRVYFSAAGQNGDYGRPGGNGGLGGRGGLGADGICGTCDPAGPGGSGASGDPANGGDGSNAAAPGTLWVAASIITGAVTGNNVSVTAGQVGRGGPGGYTWTPYPFPQSHANPCVDTPCGGGGCQGIRIKEVCNPYKAFCLLSTAITSGFHTPGTNGIFNGGYDYKSGGNLVAIYDTVANILYGVEFDADACLEIHYRANLYSSNDCIRIFRKMAFAVTSAPSPTNQKIDLTKTNDGGTCTTMPNAPLIFFNDAFNNNMFIFRGAEGYIEDVTEPGAPRCYIGSCISSTDAVVPGSVRQGGGGREGGVRPPDGVPVVAGPGGPTNPNANAVIQDMNGAPLWKMLQDEGSANQLRLYPQPADNEARLVLTADYSGKVQLEIYDLSGRLLRHWEQQLNIGQQEVVLDLAEFQKGIYLLKVQGEQAPSASLKLLVD